jgi:hypothetical protein
MRLVQGNYLFTDYAHARKRGDTEEAERLSKIIDDNALIAQQYIEEIRLAYSLEPDLPKFSFDEWLKLRGIEVVEEKPSFSTVIPEQEEISIKVRRNFKD